MIDKTLRVSSVNPTEPNNLGEILSNIADKEMQKFKRSDDLISRQAVLDGLASIAKAKAKSDAQNALMGRVMFFVEQLPSAEPKRCQWLDEDGDCWAENNPNIKCRQEPSAEKTGWIPVSEGNPKADGFYISTLDGEIVGEDKPIAGMAEFHNGKWVDDEDDYQCVLAWMPLPEPWKGDTDG